MQISRSQSDVIKGMAITGILLCHLLSKIAPVSIARLMTPVGGIGVACFLILSGYGLNESMDKHGLKGYWKKRLLGVYVPYLCIWFFSLLQMREVTGKSIVFDILAITPVAEYYWYISYLTIWYLAFYLICRFIKERYQVIVFAGLALFLFVFMEELQAEQSISFLLGVLLSRYKRKYNSKESVKVGIVLLITGISFLTIKQIPQVRLWHDKLFALLQLVIKVSLAMALFFLSNVLGRWVEDTFSKIGRISYEIYLIHSQAIVVFSIIENKFMAAMYFVVITFVGSLIFHCFYQKIMSCISCRIQRSTNL